MKVRLVLSWALLLIGSSKEVENDQAKEESSTSLPSEEIVVTGSLLNGEDEANSEITAEQDVAVKAADGTVVGASQSDENGDFEIEIAAGALQIDNAAGLVEGRQLLTTSSGFIFESTVEDDGEGKALGVRQSIDLSTGNLGAGNAVDIGSQTLLEIGAISGSVVFEQTSVSPLGTDVFIPGKSFFSRTAADGKFYLLFLPADTYTLRIENDVFFKEVEVTVESGKTTVLGEVEVGVADRNPLPLDEVLVGTWATSCWSSSTAADSPLTGEITINSLSDTSYTGTSCLSRSYDTGAGSKVLVSIAVLSDGAVILTHRIVSTGVVSTEFARVVQYSNSKITFDLTNYIEVFERTD